MNIDQTAMFYISMDSSRQDLAIKLMDFFSIFEFVFELLAENREKYSNE